MLYSTLNASRFRINKSTCYDHPKPNVIISLVRDISTEMLIFDVVSIVTFSLLSNIFNGI